MCKGDSNGKHNKGDENMPTVMNNRDIESTEIHFKSDKEFKDFMKLVNHPPEPNDRVKRIINQYKKTMDHK